MILKTKEASKYIGLSINTLKTLSNNERIKSFKTSGGHRRFMQEDLDHFTGKVTEKQDKVTVVYADVLRQSKKKILNARKTG
jgi:excisionase family DNA binding protein